MSVNENTQHLGKYHILEELGHGGFATVYRALDTTLEPEVALTVLDRLLARYGMWIERRSLSAVIGAPAEARVSSLSD